METINLYKITQTSMPKVIAILPFINLNIQIK